MINVGIVIYDGVEVLDFSGPFEVFTTADRVAVESIFRVFLIAESKGPVNCRGNYRVLPDYDLKDHPPIDVLLVAGGEHNQQLANKALLKWVASIDQQTQLTASICTGAFLLAEAGVLSGLKVTTHWEDQAELKTRYSQLTVVAGQRWVTDGKYITSGGISAGIDMSLSIVASHVGQSLAEKTAKQMEYYWNKDSMSRI